MGIARPFDRGSWTGSIAPAKTQLLLDSPRTADQFFDSQPGLNSGTFSPARNSCAGVRWLILASMRFNSSISTLDQPTVEDSISPSGEIKKIEGTWVRP